jgi:hypothetical protein
LPLAWIDAARSGQASVHRHLKAGEDASQSAGRTESDGAAIQAEACGEIITKAQQRRITGDLERDAAAGAVGEGTVNRAVEGAGGEGDAGIVLVQDRELVCGSSGPRRR